MKRIINLLILLFISFIIVSCNHISSIDDENKIENVNNDFTFDAEKIIVLTAENNKLSELCKLYLSCDKDGFIFAKLYYEDLIGDNNIINNNKPIGTLVTVLFDTFCEDELDVYSADYLDDGRLEINTNEKFTTDMTNSTELIIKFEYQGKEKSFVFNVGDVDFMIYPQIK